MNDFSPLTDSSHHGGCKHIGKLDFNLITEKLASHVSEAPPFCLTCHSEIDCWICLSCCECYCSDAMSEFTHINKHCNSVFGHYISFSVLDGSCWCELCNTFIFNGEFEDFLVRFKECHPAAHVEDPQVLGARYAEIAVEDTEKFEIDEESEGDTNSLLARRRVWTGPMYSAAYQWLLRICIVALLLVMVVILVTNRHKIFGGGESNRRNMSTSNPKPNFVFVIADDLGWNSIGHDNYDQTLYTPFLDSLAHRGVVLTNYYSQELCTPTRASLLTGRLPLHIGMQYGVITKNKRDGLDPSLTLLPAVLARLAGYKSYLVGKWHLGVYLQSLLPTARGFAEFFGYANGMEYFWSKRLEGQDAQYRDLMVADQRCYSGYNESDWGQYSTLLYRDKAAAAIAAHDYSASALLLVLAFQAVHDPYTDCSPHQDGLTALDVGQDWYDRITGGVVGGAFQQYTMSLLLLDQAVGSVHEALVQAGQIDNTYIIFASDNGACTAAGGRNGPLRGRKGTLFEGGTKVDSFIYSPLLGTDFTNRTFAGLMHVSDWFPTLLGLAGVGYTAPADQPLDGIDQSPSLLAVSRSDASTATAVVGKREHVVYNVYFNVEGQDYDLSTNGSFAVRDSRFKLMHGYSGPESGWVPEDEATASDDPAIVMDCWPIATNTTFTYYLFDLQNDPAETTNLWGDPQYAQEQQALYKVAYQYAASAALQSAVNTSYPSPLGFFAANGYFYQPWVFPTPSEGEQLPQPCTPTTVFLPLGTQ